MKTLYSLIKGDFYKEIKLLSEYFSSPSTIDNYNQIIPGLYLGNYEAAQSKTFILDKDIDLVINCSKDLKYPDFYNKLDRHNFKYIRIPVDDSKNNVDQILMEMTIPKICPIIHKYLENGQNIYVHCYAGMQRSATIVICYLIYLDMLDNNVKKLSGYYKFLKSKRPIVFKPDPTFDQPIYKFHSVMKNKIKN
jgi:protein-tyrosine phosphatase